MAWPNIEMNLPQVYMCSPSWTLLPPPSSLPIPSLWVVPVHQPQASSIMHRTWTGDSFHTWYFTCFNAILPNLPTLSLSHRVHKTVLYISVSFASALFKTLHNLNIIKILSCVILCYIIIILYYIYCVILSCVEIDFLKIRSQQLFFK